MSSGVSDSAASEWRAYWPLVLTAFVGMTLAPVMSQAIQVMMAPLEEEFGWSRTQISAGPLVVSFMGICLATAAGFAIDKLGARRIGIFVVLLTFVVLVLAAIMESYWQWILLWSLFGLAAACTSTVWMAPISSLFNRGRGFAIAVAFSGTGVTAALVPLITHFFVENHGWRAGYLGVAAIWAIVTIPLVFFFWRGAEEIHARAQADAKEASPKALTGMTVREGFASPTFYLIGFASLVSSVATVAIVMNLVPVLVSTGLSRGEAAAVAGANGLASIAGRFIGGWLMDRISAKTLAIIAVIGSATLPLGLLIAPGSIPISTIVVAITAFMGGVKAPAIVYLVSRHFGARSFGTLFGTVGTASGIAVGVGPLLANVVYDVTQSYEAVLWTAFPLYLIAGGLFALLGAYPTFAAAPNDAQTTSEDLEPDRPRNA